MQIILKNSDLEELVRSAFCIPTNFPISVSIEGDVGPATYDPSLQETKASTEEAPKRRGRPKLSDVRPVEKIETPVEAEETAEERSVVQEPEKLAEAIEELPEPIQANTEETKVEETQAPRKSLFGNLTRVTNEPAEAPRDEAPLTPAPAEDEVLEPSEDEIAEEFGTNEGDGSIVDEIQQTGTSGGTKTAAEEVSSEPAVDEAPKPRPSLFANLKK